MKIKKNLFFLFILIFSIAQLLAQEVLSFKEIDRLIQETEYDHALQMLSDYIKKYPEGLDAAQKRIDRIMKARAYYSQLANELLDVMETDPKNDEKKLAIISKLESLEKNPSEEHLAFIREAKSASESSFFRSQFRRIMEEGAAHASKREYSEAMASVKRGFYMYRDNFNETYPDSITAPVAQNVQDIENIVAQYNARHSAWQSAYTTFVQAVKSKNYENASRAWPAFQSQMQAFSELRNTLVQKGVYLENLFARLKGQGEEAQEAVNYLTFMGHFTLGSSSIENSGLLGAMNADWNFMVENSKREICSVIDSGMSDFIKDAPAEKALQKNFSPDMPSLKKNYSFASLALNVNNLDTLLLEKDGVSRVKTNSEFEKSIAFIRSLMDGLSPTYSNLAEFKKAKDEFNVLPVVPKNPMQDAKNSGGYMVRSRDVMARLEKTRGTALEYLNAEWLREYNSSDWNKESAYYKELNSLAYEKSVSTINILWTNLEQYYANAFNEFENSYNGLFNTAIALSSGIDEKTAPENNPQNLPFGRYPKEAIENVKDIKKTINSDESLVLQMQKDIEQFSPSEDNTSRAKAQSAINSLKDKDEQGQKIIVNAEAEIRLAQSSRDGGDEFYNSALAAFRRGDYGRSRQFIQRSREFYNESLSHQEDAELRESSDKKLFELGQQINDAENKIVVEEVRKLKTEARQAYYAGNFENAENLLNRAESRWAVTNVDEDEEIKNLKLMVQNALSMKTGREIKPTAPLYPEMSQILSNAHQYYDKGESLIKQGKREEAIEILNAAKKKLQELQMVYPLNQEASLLTLRIDNLIDPAQFNATFSRRVETARQNVKVPSTQQQAYSDLLDLAQIRPDYPGLRDLIYNVEIDLGIRARPVDQSGIRRSNALTQEAQRLFDSAGSNEEILRQALSRLDQAIALNPENSSAIMLKDRIQIAVGGKAAVVLSSADEADYNRAIQELRNNNIMGAYTIVEQLLQKNTNRHSTKILDLQKQIQALL